MNNQQMALWTKIKNFELDDEDSSYSFSDRLARENGWSMEYTIRVILEYKRFIFLISISDEPLTPSDPVDQVWHLHLIYTRSYWEDFCGKILNKNIHHGPTKGGEKERTKFVDWYEKTKDTYRTIFELEPTIDIWPPSKKRFSDIDFKRVNLNKYWIIKKLF